MTRGAPSAADAVLSHALGGRLRRQVPLAPLSTFGVGGDADWLFETRTPDDVCRALAAAADAGVGVTLLGGGSNVLVGDGGVRGLVVRLRHGSIARVGPRVVRVAAGVTLNGLVRWTIAQGLGGLEGWAGTPGTVGGAVYGNAHFQGRLLGDEVVRVGVAGADGAEHVVTGAAMEFGYDRSRLQRTSEAALWVEFRVDAGDPALLRARARAALAYRKRTQPLDVPSAGCIFRNPDLETIPGDLPLSAGALVERAGLKGVAVGRARVSEVHANFIVSDGRSSAGEIRSLIEHCRAKVEIMFGVRLRREVVYLGEFSQAVVRYVPRHGPSATVKGRTARLAGPERPRGLGAKPRLDR